MPAIEPSGWIRFFAVLLAGWAGLLGQDATSLQHGFVTYTLGGEKWLVLKVVDAHSWEGIADATLDCVEERFAHLPGDAWRLSRAVTDRFGVARMRLDNLPADAERGWFFLAARGYGARSRFRMTGMQDVWALAKCPVWRVKFVKWDGLPLANTVVGACLGSGYTPDFETRTTDIDGFATWDSVDPLTEDLDFYVYAPECWIGPYVVPQVTRKLSLGHVVCEPSVTISGRLGPGLREAGVQDVLVGSIPRSHRGPWTRPSPQGAFALVGARPNARAVLLDVATEKVTRIHRDEDGEWVESDAATALDLPPPEPSSRWVALHLRGTVSGRPRVQFHDAFGKRSVEADGLVWKLPVAGRGVVHIADGLFERTIRVEGDEQRIDMDWPEPCRISAMVEDPSGKPATGSYSFADEVSFARPVGPRQIVGGRVLVQPLFDGPLFIQFKSEDGTRDLLCVADAERGKSLDLGTVRLGSVPTEWPAPGDAVGPGSELRWIRPSIMSPDGAQPMGTIVGTTWRSALIEAGDWIEVREREPEGAIRARRRFRATEPGRVSWPPCGGLLKLRILDTRFESGDVYALVIGGEQWWVTAPEIVVSGLSEGSTRLTIAAADGRSVALTVISVVGRDTEMSCELK